MTSPSTNQNITGPSSKWLHLIRYFRNPLGHYQSLQAKHGDPFKVPFLLGNEMVVTGDPEGVREIFATPYDQFDPVDQTENPFLGRNALVILAGEAHRRARKLLGPHFHGQRIKCYGDTIQTTTLKHASAWPVDQAFQAVEVLQRISLEIILKTIFGVVQPERIELFAKAIHNLRGKIGFWIIFVPALRKDLGPWSPWTKFIRARDELDRLIYQQIVERRADPTGGEDILSQMLRWKPDDAAEVTDEQIRDHLLTLLAAGHSTSATATAWALYWICYRADVQKKALEEIEAFSNCPLPDVLAGLPYLDAVCKEALRIHPIALEVARRLKNPISLRGHVLSSGTVLSASIYLSHYNPQVYPQPEVFRPERFLERNFAPSEYLPFGGGVRVCIGAHMGVYMIRVILGTLLWSHDIILAEAGPVLPVWKEGVMEPRGGILIKIRPRRGRGAA